MIRLIRELVRPYRGSLVVILLAMLVETASSLATPWPLKIIIDNVVGSHKLSPWLADLLRPWMDGHHQMHIAALAASPYVNIALLAPWLDDAMDHAFFPLTLPITVGPGCISRECFPPL